MAFQIGDRNDPPKEGTFTSNGSTGVAITFSTPALRADYTVSIEAVTDPAGHLGEWWTSAKTVNGFTFHHSGNAGLSLRYKV